MGTVVLVGVLGGTVALVVWLVLRFDPLARSSGSVDRG